MFLKPLMNFIKLGKWFLMLLKREYFHKRQLKEQQSPKQLYQRLPTALAQIKVGIASENLLNEKLSKSTFLYQAK